MKRPRLEDFTCGLTIQPWLEAKTRERLGSCYPVTWVEALGCLGRLWSPRKPYDHDKTMALLLDGKGPRQRQHACARGASGGQCRRSTAQRTGGDP